MTLHSIKSEKKNVEGLLAEIAKLYPLLAANRRFYHGIDNVEVYLQIRDIMGYSNGYIRRLYYVSLMDGYYDEEWFSAPGHITLNEALENMLELATTEANEPLIDEDEEEEDEDF